MLSPSWRWYTENIFENIFKSESVWLKHTENTYRSIVHLWDKLFRFIHFMVIVDHFWNLPCRSLKNLYFPFTPECLRKILLKLSTNLLMILCQLKKKKKRKKTTQSKNFIWELIQPIWNLILAYWCADVYYCCYCFRWMNLNCKRKRNSLMQYYHGMLCTKSQTSKFVFFIPGYYIYIVHYTSICKLYSVSLCICHRIDKMWNERKLYRRSWFVLFC